MKKKHSKGTLALILGIFLIAGVMQMGCNTQKGSLGNSETQVLQTEIVGIEDKEIENSQTDAPETEEIESETDVGERASETAAIEIAIGKMNASVDAFSTSSVPAYSGTPYVALNNNVPFFTDEEITVTAFELYSDLDSLGRCGVAYANICKEIMPTEERGNIGSIKPSGWHTIKYDCVDGKYLYNRCHLIGFQLAGENANEKNLITGTRYLNVEGMLPFENMVDDYVDETGNHVLYRVTPVFEGDNLLASGVILEAKSVEDNGAGILFNVYCYNVQPGIDIDYASGSSAQTSAAEESVQETPVTQEPVVQEPVAQEPVAQEPVTGGGENLVWLSETGSKYHSINNCGTMNPDNARQVTEAEAINLGKGKCKKCW